MWSSCRSKYRTNEVRKLGRVACKDRSGGDFIDYGLQSLQHLQDEGFGVFEIGESDPSSQPAPEVAKLVEALAAYRKGGFK